MKPAVLTEAWSRLDAMKARSAQTDAETRILQREAAASIRQGERAKRLLRAR